MLGIVSLSQINRTPQQGRGLAIAGIAIGSVTVTLLLASIAVLAAHHPDVHRGLIPYPVGGTNRSDCRSIPAARPFAAITNAILRLASSSISSPSITAPRAPPAADVCHS